MHTKKLDMVMAKRRAARTFDFLAETLMSFCQHGRFQLSGKPGMTGSSENYDCRLVQVTRHDTVVMNITFTAAGPITLSTAHGSHVYDGDERGYFWCRFAAWIMLQQVMMDSLPAGLAA